MTTYIYVRCWWKPPCLKQNSSCSLVQFNIKAQCVSMRHNQTSIFRAFQSQKSDRKKWKKVKDGQKYPKIPFLISHSWVKKLQSSLLFTPKNLAGIHGSSSPICRTSHLDLHLPGLLHVDHRLCLASRATTVAVDGFIWKFDIYIYIYIHGLWFLGVFRNFRKPPFFFVKHMAIYNSISDNTVFDC